MKTADPEDFGRTRVQTQTRRAGFSQEGNNLRSHLVPTGPVFSAETVHCVQRAVEHVHERADLG